MWSLFTLDTPLRLLNVKGGKKTYKCSFPVVGGQIACHRKIPLINALCHGFNFDLGLDMGVFNPLCATFSSPFFL